jgi:hypothetical protein
VDVRHDATHGELPSFDVLKYAADEAMRWLENTYWLPQLHVVKEIRQRIGKWINELRDHHLVNPRSYDDSTSSELQTSSHRQILKRITNSLSPNLVSDVLLPLLFRADYLVPKSIAKEKRSVQEILDYGWGDVLDTFACHWSHFSFVFLDYVIHKLHQHYQTRKYDLFQTSHHVRQECMTEESVPISARVVNKVSDISRACYERVVFSKYRVDFYVGLAKYMLDWCWNNQRYSSTQLDDLKKLHEHLLGILFCKWNPANRLIARHLVNRIPSLKRRFDTFLSITETSQILPKEEVINL